MPVDLAPVVAATARWLSHAYPSPWPGAFSAALVELQARQAVTVAAWLRYPTAIDAELLTIAGPGGADRLDWVGGLTVDSPPDTELAWRAWVDEVVASWAANLLTDPLLSAHAVAALARRTSGAGLPTRFRRLLDPDEQDRRASALLRHPDLVEPVADLHRVGLLDMLSESPHAAPAADAATRAAGH
ncbi:hypothetical protein [Pilimelia columellifera]